MIALLTPPTTALVDSFFEKIKIVCAVFTAYVQFFEVIMTSFSNRSIVIRVNIMAKMAYIILTTVS